MADQEKDPTDPKRNPVDIESILLPKKEVAGESLDSARRVSAGALFAQEKEAGATGTGTTPEPRPTVAPVNTPVPASETSLHPLQTYKSDIESLVQKGGVSEVSIAAAEATRRGSGGGKDEAAASAAEPRVWKKWLYGALGVLLVGAALALVAYVLLRQTSVPLTPTGAQAAIIFVDESKVVSVTPPRAAAMQALVAARDATDIPLGLIARLVVVHPAVAGQDPAVWGPAELLTLLAPTIPIELVRTLSPEYLLAVHSFDEEQAVLLLRTDSYEVAYRGMLEWEPTLFQDLSPLFVRTPPVHLNQTPAPAAVPAAPAATSTATSTAVATSTPTSTAPTIQAVINTGFMDKIVENRDTRVVQNAAGDILLLWTFLDRNTIVIVTNDATLREVISRVARAPVISVPE